MKLKDKVVHIQTGAECTVTKVIEASHKGVPQTWVTVDVHEPEKFGPHMGEELVLTTLAEHFRSAA